MNNPTAHMDGHDSDLAAAAETISDLQRRLAEAEAEAEAEAKLVEAQKDAERYRWLRANCVNGRMESPGPYPDFAMNCDEPENEWDAAIDTAKGDK